MSPRTPNRHRGFTLIELLVVVAIIALLISILLPSLSDAKEQAKIAQCLANLRTNMTATQMYFHDWNDSFPFIVQLKGNTLGICSWSFGGKTPDNYWKTMFEEVFYMRVQERTFNEYIMGGPVQPDLVVDGKIVRRTPIPPLECPSDTRCTARCWNDPAYPGPYEMASHDDVGTSYRYNLHALMDTNEDEWANLGEGWQKIGRQLVRDAMKGQTSTLTMFHEDPMQWGLHEQIPVVGNHGKMNKHACGYLDGHADYVTRDTRRWCGVGWTSINPLWIRNPIVGYDPPLYYRDPTKNCNP